MKRLLLTITFALAVTAAASAQDIGGKYRIEGRNPDGSTYAGTVVITLNNRNSCKIERQTDTFASGICMLHGNTLAATYLLSENIGLVFYEVHADGTLAGEWTVAEKTGFGSEQLFPVR